MNKKLHILLLTALTLLVMVVSAVQPMIAHADDNTPPAPAAPASGDTSAPAATQPPAAASPAAPADTSASSVDTSVAPASTSVAPVDTSVAPVAATSVAPADTSVAPADTSSVAPADTLVAPVSTSAAPANTSVASASTSATSASTSTAPAAASTLVGSVPTGTPVVVLDATGTAVPLATQTAAAIIKTSDPMWCPGSQTPGTSGCTSGYGSVTALITGLGSVTPKAGTVYFDSTSTYSTNDATFDGSTAALSAWKTYALTLQGGWNSTTNVVSGVSTLNVPLTITNWAANVTITDITISGATGDGLTVQTTGNSNITVHNVKSNHNSGNGAYLNNDSVLPAATGAIIISDSDFNNNGTAGVSYHDGFGVEAISNGNITLTDVTADDNYDDGAYLDNCLDGGAGSCTNGASNNGISVDNSGISGGDGFNDNGKGNNAPFFGFGSEDGYGNGLEAYSTETVTLTNVIADDNIFDGARLGYYQADGGPYDEIGGDVKVTGGDFSNNNFQAGLTEYPAGLEAYADGSISLSGVIADYNTYNGAYLDHCLNDLFSGECTGNSSSSIIVGSSEFNNNTSSGQDFGMIIDTEGNVTLNSVKTNGNEAGDGTDVYDFSNLLIQDSFFNDNFSTYDSWGNGLFISSPINGESVVLNNVQTSGNGSLVHADGTYVNIPGQLTVDPSQFDDNINGSGLEAVANNITITCSDLSNNNQYGVNANLSGGTLTLNGDTLSHNGSGATNLSGGTLVVNSVNCSHGGGKGTTPIVGGAGPLPWNTINVPDSGGQGHPLECTQYSGTELILPNHDHARLPCPIGSITGTSGSLSRLTSDKLPDILDSKFTFVSAVDADVNPALTGGMMTVSFTIPAGKQGANFAILHWDGTKWVNLGGSINPPGFLSVDTNLTGDFVLVTQ